jgi:hypothetical protein
MVVHKKAPHVVFYLKYFHARHDGTCNPSTGEVMARGSGTQGLHSEILFLKVK